MKMNIILMIIGAVIFAVGAAMTFKKPEQEKTNEISSAAVYNEPIERQDEKPQESQDSVIDENKQKGNDFEDYVANVLNANSLTIKDWNKGTVTEDGAFGENALNPDMFVVDKETKIGLEYWMECKYRSYLTYEGFKLEDSQLDRYKAKQKETKRKVLIALGVGRSASAPERFFIIPLDSLIRYKHIPEKYIVKYKVEDPKWRLKEYIRNYFFEEVFKKNKN